MTYTNHIILRGLDEARAHQRGTVAGRPPKEHEKPKERRDPVLQPIVEPQPVREKPEKATEKGRIGRKRHHSDEFRLQMATTMGTYSEVSTLLDCEGR